MTAAKLRSGAASKLFCGLFFRFHEWFSLEFAALLDQNLDLSFRILELLTAGVGQSHAILKQLQRLFEGKIPTLELLHDFLQLLQTLFKFRQVSLRRHCMERKNKGKTRRGLHGWDADQENKNYDLTIFDLRFENLNIRLPKKIPNLVVLIRVPSA